MRARRWTGLPSPLVLVAFLFAAGGELLPGHECPHHDRVPGASAPTQAHAGHTAATAAAAVVEAPADGPGHGQGSHEHGEGPCTCVGACHAGAATPVAAGSVGHRLPLVAADVVAAILPGSAAPVRPPLPYRLHQPNAPPVRA